MKVYGFVIQAFGEQEVPDVSVRLFTSKHKMEMAIEDLILTENEEISTFESDLKNE